MVGRDGSVNNAKLIFTHSTPDLISPSVLPQPPSFPLPPLLSHTSPTPHPLPHPSNLGEMLFGMSSSVPSKPHYSTPSSRKMQFAPVSAKNTSCSSRIGLGINPRCPPHKLHIHKIDEPVEVHLFHDIRLAACHLQYGKLHVDLWRIHVQQCPKAHHAHIGTRSRICIHSARGAFLWPFFFSKGIPS